MTIEQVKPVMQRVDKIKREITLFRFQEKSRRWYYQHDFDNDDVVFYPSVTSIIGVAYPEPDFLTKLKADMGLSKFYQWLNEKAHLGTFIHEQLSSILAYGVYDFNEIATEIEEYASEHRLNFDYKWWHFEIKKYMYCFMKFFEDVQIKPLAIELPVIYYNTEWDLGFASMIDCVAEINVKKGKKVERKIAIIDWKSGTNTFPTHELQLQMYSYALQDTYGINADVLMNVMPNATLKNYKVKTYDDLNTPEEFMHYVGFYHKLHKEPKPIRMISKDSYILNHPVDDYFKMITAADFIINKTKEN